jgi:hypothetical protein
MIFNYKSLSGLQRDFPTHPFVCCAQRPAAGRITEWVSGE